MVSKARLYKEFIPYIRDLKRIHNFRIFETHVHPYDVIGVVHYHDYVEVSPGEFVHKKFAGRKGAKDKSDLIGWLSKFDYNKYAFSLFNFALQIIPGYENFDLEHAFSRTGVCRLLEEMDEALVDEIVLLPVEPWLPIDHVQKIFAHQRLKLLGSVDIHRIHILEIEDTIKHFVDDYGIIGLKLHPNMQSFMPQPSHNSSHIAEKLRLIYQTADEYGLYLLFHGGPSGLAKNRDEKYGGLTQKSRNGVLSNFCDENGKSELLGQYRVPVVIAHLGHFGASKLNTPLVRTILDRHDSVYFDTAGAPSGSIQKFIEWGGSQRLFFGSDALYFRIMYSMYSVYKAAHKVRSHENPDEIMANILGKNFEQHILRRKDNEHV